ncbi:MAG: hypothetical protein DMG70_08080 [Acidobacteria bacterium]|nr:MAG: hypothetical protein DMG70_08080 [Acidobacteriota bacterium]
MFNLLGRFSRFVLSLLLLSFLLGPAARASDWSDPEQQLAQKITAITGPGAVSLDLVNRSSLSQADIDGIRSTLRNQLSAAGLTLVNPDQAAATVQVSLSENLQSYVWVARIQQGTNQPAIEIVSVPRVEPGTPLREPAVLLIRKIQLWSQEDPILDVAVIDSSPPHVIVLDPNKIAMHALEDGQWQLEQAFQVPHSRPWPRDLRGRLVLRKDHLVDAYLPGIFCSSAPGAALNLSCRESDDPWPLASEQLTLNGFFSPTRNFFTGALAPGIGQERTVPPFYSAAPIPREKYVLWVLTGIDGQVREVDGVNVQTLSRPGWGSDMASTKTSCGSGSQVLVSSNSDGATPDTVRAYEFPDREPVPVSQPVELGGRITSLWTESSGSTAVVVSRNWETGKYEAFRLTIACGQ